MFLKVHCSEVSNFCVVCKNTNYINCKCHFLMTNFICINRIIIIIIMSRDSSVGMATGYGLDARGLSPTRVKLLIFSTASRLALGPKQPPDQWVPGSLSSGVKWRGREDDHSPPSVARSRMVELCLQYPTSFHVKGLN
jgi:hypothetical protein